jgi:zinc protease
MRLGPVMTAAALLLTLAAGVAGAAPTLVRSLDNGVQVAVFSDHRLPIVQIQVLVPAGNRNEEPLEAGAATLTAMLLTRGTTSRTSSQFAHDVAALGGTVVGDAARDYATLTGAFRSADLDQGLELVADAIMNPIFEDAELAGARQDLVRRVVDSRSHLDIVAEEHVWAEVMKGHPYAAPPGGTLETIAALSRQRVAAFHRAQYRPDHALIAVAGDVDPERAFASVQETFGRWSGRTRTLAPSTAREVKPSRFTIRLVDVPGATGAELRLAVPVSARGAEDTPVLAIANDLLGGGAGSRLAGTNLRAVQAYSLLEQQREGGLLILATSAGNDSVVPALGRLRDELGRFSGNPPAQADVDRSRRILARSFPLRNETLGAQSAQWLTSAFLGLDKDYSDRYTARLMTVTSDQVRDVARRYFDPAHAEAVVVGAAEALKAGLERLGPVEVVSIQEPPNPVETAPAMRMDVPDAAAIEAGRKRVQLALVAHGGLPRLRSIKDSRVEADITLYHSGENVTGKQVELRREPGQLRTETTFMQLMTVQAVHGDTAWTRMSSGKNDSTFNESPETAVAMRRAFASDVPHLLLTAADPKSRVAFRGQDEAGGGLADVVEVVAADEARWVLFLDPRTHRLVAAEDNQGSPLRGAALRRLFADLRTEQGVLWPHREERQVDGERTLTLTVSRVQINTGIPPEAFWRNVPAAASHRRR